MNKIKALLFAALLAIAGTSYAQTAAQQETPAANIKKTDKEGPKLKKDGTVDKRFAENQKLKKDGTPDKRYSDNKNLKKDGTVDKRFKTTAADSIKNGKKKNP